MADVSTWSPNDAANNQAPPDGWPEGMPASSVNDTGRATHGAVRRLAEDGGWFDWGHTYSYVSADTFQITGTFSPSPYIVGRRVRIVQTATVYGTITSVSETANTDVTVALDSGSIANEAMTVSLGPDPGALGGAVLAGAIVAYAGTVVPAGWLLCDGTQYDPNLYPNLFAAISNTYGGDGINTFEVPDLRGRSPIGVGDPGTTGQNTITLAQGQGGASVLGTSTHTLTEAQMPAHTHNTNIVDSGTQTEDAPAQTVYEVGTGGNATSTAGASQPHNNQSPALGLNFVIKT